MNSSFDGATLTDEEWQAVAISTREGRFFVCFDDPEDPMVWAEIQNDGEVRDLGFLERQCKRDHSHMGCGFYRMMSNE